MLNFKSTPLLLLPLFLLTHATSPGDPKGDYLSTMPLAATLRPGNATCPFDTSTCPNSSTTCCPRNTTCLKKQDVNGVPGWGCCTTHLGSTCPLLLSNEKCAVNGWVVCGAISGSVKSATCCEKMEFCRDVGKGVYDCGAGSVTENQTEVLPDATQTGNSPLNSEETSGGVNLQGGIGMGVGGVVALTGLWVA